jgi:hypothetical protein
MDINTKDLSLGGKLSVKLTTNLPASNAGVKNDWSFSSTPSYA